MTFLRLSDVIAANQLRNKRVFIRADLNVPLDSQGHISDDTRLRASLPAMKQACEAGAAVMVTSHLGRPTEGQLTDTDSLAPVAERLSALLGQDVVLRRDWLDGVDVQCGHIVLLENCRGHVGEKKNDPVLAKKMAALCDVYVNDAFGAAHRAEATTVGIAEFAPVACAGPLLAAELDALGHALHQPPRPLVAIVGGAKVSTKLMILTSLADRVDHLIVGGGIANTFLLASGVQVGNSLVDLEGVNAAKSLIARMEKRGAQVPLPVDVVCAKTFSAAAVATVKTLLEIADDDMILDIGPATSALWAAHIEAAGTIVWNGPVGVFEFDQFGTGTQAIAHAIGHAPAFSIAGGGDTLAAIAKYKVAHQIDYISTGGGAFLEFLEGKTLPAVEVLMRRAQQ